MSTFPIGLLEAALLLGVLLAVAAVWSYRKRMARVRWEESPPSSARRDIPTARASTARTAGSDVFLSYAAPDRPTAQRLAAALSAEGWSVWWDRTIPPGQTFDAVIEAALDSATCVIVLWSKASVSSDWVKVEAAEGARRRVLVPAVIEEVTIPLEFRRIQAASLIDWRASTSHPGFESLVSSVTHTLEKGRQHT